MLVCCRYWENQCKALRTRFKHQGWKASYNWWGIQSYISLCSMPPAWYTLLQYPPATAPTASTPTLPPFCWSALTQPPIWHSLCTSNQSCVLALLWPDIWLVSLSTLHYRPILHIIYSPTLIHQPTAFSCSTALLPQHISPLPTFCCFLIAFKCGYFVGAKIVDSELFKPGRSPWLS